MENHKKEQGLRKQSWGLPPYNAHPKIVPLIKIQIDVVSFKCLFYKKKIKIKINKKDHKEK